MPKITLNNLTYVYVNKKTNTGVAPVCNLSTTIKNNSFSVIIGESGSGKTTLLKLITGLIRPYEGTILFVSHDRYFINKVATKVVNIDNCKLNLYIGNYDDYKNYLIKS